MKIRGCLLTVTVNNQNTNLSAGRKVVGIIIYISMLILAFICIFKNAKTIKNDLISIS